MGVVAAALSDLAVDMGGPGRGVAAALGLPGQEGGEAFLAEAGGASWGRVALVSRARAS